MAAKDVKFNRDARERILKGVDILAVREDEALRAAATPLPGRPRDSAADRAESEPVF